MVGRQEGKAPARAMRAVAAVCHACSVRVRVASPFSPPHSSSPQPVILYRHGCKAAFMAALQRVSRNCVIGACYVIGICSAYNRCCARHTDPPHAAPLHKGLGSQPPCTKASAHSPPAQSPRLTAPLHKALGSQPPCTKSCYSQPPCTKPSAHSPRRVTGVCDWHTRDRLTRMVRGWHMWMAHVNGTRNRTRD